MARLVAVAGGLDLGAMVPADAKAVVAAADLGERVLHGLKVQAAARVAASAAWRAEGDRTAADWLARTTGTTAAEAARAVTTGERLNDLPATKAAVARGELSPQQAEAIAGAATADPAAEQRLLDTAGSQNLRGLKDACRRTRANADPDPDATARRIHRQRSYRTWTDGEGVGHIHLSGPPATIARVDNAVRRNADRIFREARTEGRREPAEAYAFDALVDRVTNSSGPPVPAGADAKIIVRIDHSALVRGHAVGDETCEIAGIGPLPVSTVRDWMSDAFVAAVLTKGTDVTRVVHLGRRFTALQRTALEWQNPVCATPGCTNRLRLENDHVDDWAHTHTTRVQAGQRLCPTCHRRKTLGHPPSPPPPPPPSPSPTPAPPPPPPPSLADADERLRDAIDQAIAHARTLFGAR